MAFAACVGRQSAQVTPVITDSQGNTWVIQILDGTFYMAYALNSKAGANTVTFGPSGQTEGVVIAEYSGVKMTAALDQSLELLGATATGCGPVTTTAPSELIIGGLGIGSGTTTCTVAGGF